MPSDARLEEPMTVQSESVTETDLAPVLSFVAPMPGFPDHREFLLVRIGDQDLLYSLTSIADPELRFLVIPPGGFFPDYMPEVDDETLELLGSREAEDLLVLLVVTPGGSAREATANLLAPIIIDQPHRRAVQAVLAGSGLPVRAPLMAMA
jgi:flagellar assembly factor FliW